jgi:hypothetical protein
VLTPKPCGKGVVHPLFSNVFKGRSGIQWPSISFGTITAKRIPGSSKPKLCQSTLQPMKARFLLLLLCLAFAMPTFGVPTELARWTFETSQPTSAGPFNPESGLQTATATASGSGLSTITSPVGNGSAHSFSGNGWNTGDYWQFRVSMLGFQSLTISWDQAGSATGPRDFGLFWSTDGVAFSQFGADYKVLLNPSPSTWNSSTAHPEYSFAQDLSTVLALNNASTVYLRLRDTSGTAINGGAVGTTGTDRIDNFTVMASAIPPPPASVPESLPSWFSAIALLPLLLFRLRRQRAARMKQ